MEFFTDLVPLLKAFWIIAIPTSIIFLIQAIMTFRGMDSTDGINADFNSTPDQAEIQFKLFTLRNLINFLLGFSWTGIILFNTIDSTAMLLFVSFLVGGFFVAAFFSIISRIQRVAENNSLRIEYALNQIGTVYQTIPEKKTGKGKVRVSIKGSFHELDAVTENEKIESSALVKITKVESNDLVLVERI